MFHIYIYIHVASVALFSFDFSFFLRLLLALCLGFVCTQAVTFDKANGMRPPIKCRWRVRVCSNFFVARSATCSISWRLCVCVCVWGEIATTTTKVAVTQVPRPSCCRQGISFSHGSCLVKFVAILFLHLKIVKRHKSCRFWLPRDNVHAHAHVPHIQIVANAIWCAANAGIIFFFCFCRRRHQSRFGCTLFSGNAIF